MVSAKNASRGTRAPYRALYSVASMRSSGSAGMAVV